MTKEQHKEITTFAPNPKFKPAVRGVKAAKKVLDERKKTKSG